MKIRTDFVTNSSSSSYICEICGETYSGWDISLEDAEMYECENGHIFCREHALQPTRETMKSAILGGGDWSWYDKETDSYIDCTPDYVESMSDDDMFNMITSDGDGVSECVCPICNFDEYSEKDMADYLFKEYGIPREDVFAEIKKHNKRRKKLYDSEYIVYVAKEHDVNIVELPSKWKETFGTYAEFEKYIRGKA